LEDLLQEVFLVAHRKGGFEPGPAKATTWLSGIAVRVWSNAARTRRRRPSTPMGDDVSQVSAQAVDPERETASRRSLARVQRCLEQLDPDHRAVFVLFELEGVSCSQIAESLGVPVGTIYRRLHTARARVRAYYTEMTGDADVR